MERLKTAPTEYPLAREDLDDHLHDVPAEDNGYVDLLIAKATEVYQEYTGRLLITQTWTHYLDVWPDIVQLERQPVSSISEIRYLDSDGVQQTLASIEYRADAIGGRITPAYGKVWPTTREVTNAIEIDYVAGYGAAGAVPEDARGAMQLLIGHWYENRSEVVLGTMVSNVPMAARFLMDQKRVNFL